MSTEATLNTIWSSVPFSNQQEIKQEERAHKTEIQKFCYILNSLPAAGSNESNTDVTDCRVAAQEDIIIPQKVELTHEAAPVDNLVNFKKKYLIAAVITRNDSGTELQSNG